MNRAMQAPLLAPPSGSPVILDFDASVLPVAGAETRIPLGNWQEEIRFGCSWASFARLETHLNSLLPQEHGCVFTGSGDFHHVSLLLLRRLGRMLPPASLDLVVCDNHPDNMRYPFGIHCGSWVAHAARLDCIRQIHVLGITSADIGLAHAWENVLSPLLGRKLSYWSMGGGAPWLALLGRAAQNRRFETPEALLAAFAPALNGARHVYLSVDKDVFRPDVVRTNWDQGLFAFEHIQAVISICAGQVIGADITGDVSSHQYASRFKRFLSGLDGQEEAGAALPLWQEAQRKMNISLLELLEKRS